MPLAPNTASSLGPGISLFDFRFRLEWSQWDFCAFGLGRAIVPSPGRMHARVRLYRVPVVSPSPFGIYLNKIGCFCFEKQTLKAGETKEFILTFFLDPKVVDDNKTKNIADVTLSFTFFSSDYFQKDNS